MGTLTYHDMIDVATLIVCGDRAGEGLCTGSSPRAVHWLLPLRAPFWVIWFHVFAADNLSPDTFFSFLESPAAFSGAGVSGGLCNYPPAPTPLPSPSPPPQPFHNNLMPRIIFFINKIFK
ncbi:hypothetical protein FKM82_029407, partial [Ascaphus truei]